MHHYVEKQVFSWRAKNSYILCIITWKSRFSHDAPKKCKFVTLLRVKAGFLMMRQKGANLLHYYLEKQVFSWRAKTLIFYALFRGKAGFLMTRQKGANLLHYYVSKQFFSWSAEKVQICCIITWKSRFSHDVPKTLIFDVLKREKAGFLMTRPKLKCTFDALLRFVAGFLLMRQKLLYFMHYYVEKQVFSWRAKKVQICCLITWKTRFSHDAPKKCKFVALLRVKAGFLMTRQKSANLLPYYV